MKATLQLTPTSVHDHRIALAVVANMGSGKGTPGFARFHCTVMTNMFTTQPSEPNSSNRVPA